MELAHLRLTLFVCIILNSVSSFAVTSSVTFDAPAQYESGGVYPDIIKVDDINSDGHKDVMISSESNIHFLLGDGTGALNKDNSLQPSFFGISDFIVDDFNNDGIRDLAISQAKYQLYIYADNLCSKTTEGVMIFLGSGGETPRFNFKHCIIRGAPNSPGAIASGDFNGDGIADIVMNGAIINQSLNQAIYFGNGDGTFSTTPVAVGPEAKVIKVADVDGDTYLDIISGSGGYRGKGDGTFTADLGVALSSRTYSKSLSAMGDINGDGIVDVAHVYSTFLMPNGPNTLLELNYYDSSTGGRARTVTDLGKQIQSIAIEDLNNDSFGDMVVWHSGRGVNVYLGAGDGSFLSSQLVTLVSGGTYPGTNFPIQSGTDLMAIGDWNEDGFQDLSMVANITEQDAPFWVTLQTPTALNDTIAPNVSLVTPLAGTSVANIVSLTATASDDTGVTRVDFFIGNTLVGGSAGPAYAVSWDTRTTPDGIYTLTAKAYDAAGNTGSSSISVTVANALPAFTSSPSLSGVEAGVLYNYQAIATGNGPISYSLVIAPSGMSIDSITGIISWIPDGTQLGPHPVKVRATNNTGFAEQGFNLNVIDTTPPTTPTAGRVVSSVAGVSVTLNWQASSDHVGVTGYRVYRYYYISRFNKGWRLVADNITGTGATVTAVPSGGKAPSYRITAFDAAGNESAKSASILIPSGSNTAPTVSISVASTMVSATDTVTLTGSAVDDGQPNAVLTYTWSATSAAGTVSFANVNSAVTTAIFPVAGTYQLFLTVSDGALQGSTSVTISVGPANGINIPPFIRAWGDQTITLPVDNLVISASAGDLDQIIPGNNSGFRVSDSVVSYQWSMLNGPGLVSFTPVSGTVTSGIASTRAYFTSAGAYTIQLSVNDGVFTTTHSQIVNVVAATVLPVVDPNAGTVEIAGSIDSVGVNNIVVNGVTIWINSATIVKYEDFAQLAMGYSIQGKAQPNLDGSMTAIKLQVQ